MSKLSPAARRRSLRLQLERFQRKIDKTQEEIRQLEQQQSDDPPELFRQGNRTGSNKTEGGIPPRNTGDGVRDTADR